MATLQTATVNDAGTQFAYVDSGAPPSDTYTTLVIVHGHTYHAQNFSRLLPIAQNHKLRIVALNRRDYVGSTPFSPAELDVLNSKEDEEHVSFLQARGLEVARFLVWVISEMKIPRASADGKEGGLALMGWSLGNLTTTAFLRQLRSYPSDVVETIRPYLRTFYIYESGAGTLGYPSPEGGYYPLSDPSVPPRMMGVYFGAWVSSYCKHPYFSASGKLDRVISSLYIRTPEGNQVYRPCTLDTLTPTELMNCVDPGPAERSEPMFMSNINRAILYDQMQGILCLDHKPPNMKDTEAPDDQSSTTSPLLPDVKICIMYGDSSIWTCIWCIWELEKDYAKWEMEGRKLRERHFLPVEGANHFLHWDDAELFLKVVEDGIRS